MEEQCHNNTHRKEGSCDIGQGVACCGGGKSVRMGAQCQKCGKEKKNPTPNFGCGRLRHWYTAHASGRRPMQKQSGKRMRGQALPWRHHTCTAAYTIEDQSKSDMEPFLFCGANLGCALGGCGGNSIGTCRAFSAHNPVRFHMHQYGALRTCSPTLTHISMPPHALTLLVANDR
jgi:hypothetical protein